MSINLADTLSLGLDRNGAEAEVALSGSQEVDYSRTVVFFFSKLSHGNLIQGAAVSGSECVCVQAIADTGS